MLNKKETEKKIQEAFRKVQDIYKSWEINFEESVEVTREADLHFELYHQLRKQGISIEFICCEMRYPGKRTRCDLVIFNNRDDEDSYKNWAYAIEIKHIRSKNKRGREAIKNDLKRLQRIKNPNCKKYFFYFAKKEDPFTKKDIKSYNPGDVKIIYVSPK